MHDTAITTFLFTDIEGSTRLWEERPAAMREALARHDAIVREAVESHGGRVVKMTGDGLHAAFDDPLGGVEAALALQRALADPASTAGVALRVRCGLHAGVHEARDNDFYGTAVNRAARIMSAAHGGQVLLSNAVAALVTGRLRDGASLRDLGPVRLRDLASPEQVYQLVHPALRADFPALRALETIPNNLPQELTPFVGRERDAAGVRALVERSRLTTVTGMGGLGKTRLALHVAAHLLDQFPDGVWLVELADIADARLVPQALANALHVQEEPGRAMHDTLVAYLSGRRTLLLLDNCEHLLDAVTTLARRILASAPAVRILATSREPLRLAGESVYVLPALEVPNLRAPFEPEFLLQNDAARLFVQRARAARADFELTVANAPEVAAICHRLDGIPLALELAAARVRTLPLDALAERLKDRFRLLRSGDRTAASRQQTLQALIDWSYELLDDGERALLAQLSVFAGGWTLEAAEAVCDCGDDGDVLELLARLVEKSLVMHNPATGRYRMLETVRQYAHERLTEAGGASDAHARHLEYFRALAAKAEAGFVGPEAARWLATLDAELDNILAALGERSQSPAAAQDRLRLATHMKRYWLHRALLQAGLQATLDSLAHPGAMQARDARKGALFAAGQLHYLLGQYAAARELLTQSVDIARAVGDDTSLPALMQSLGMVAQAEGDIERARGYLEDALAFARRAGEKRRIAAAMNALAQLELAAGQVVRARPLLESVVALSTDVDDREGVAIGLLNLAIASILSNVPEQAMEALRRALPVAAQLDSARIDKSLLEVCAGLAAASGDAPCAARFYGAAESQGRSTGLRRDPSDEAFLAPLMRQAREALGDARFDAEVQAGSRLAAREAAEAARAWLLKDPG